MGTPSRKPVHREFVLCLGLRVALLVGLCLLMVSTSSPVSAEQQTGSQENGTSESVSDESTTDLAEGSEEACPDGDYDQEPVEVEVTATPIVVDSTTSDYFVLYVRHDLDDEVVDIPVSVTLGEEGTTTLKESVEALPAERYRVEKYVIASPADIDGDCVDDITELGDPAVYNPANPAGPIERGIGTVGLPDTATFEEISLSHSATEVYRLVEGD